MSTSRTDLCRVAPSPEAEERILAAEREQTGVRTMIPRGRPGRRDPAELAGFNDGLVAPAAPAPERAPLHGPVRVIVVLVDFADKVMTRSADAVSDLFFSLGTVPTGSVREYYREVSNGAVDVVGEVVGPLRMPETLAWYANGNYGIGDPDGTTRARDLALHAAKAADALVDLTPYDNDGDGFVDGFVVLHAGQGAEVTLDRNQLWSHKWTLREPYAADGTSVFAYLTVPEDAKLGVCAHELGHLLFGLPDLYDTDRSSAGLGTWCLMAAGSWAGGGDRPVHPSAWCKARLGWVTVSDVDAPRTVTLPDVKTGHEVLRIPVDGPEYFLLENRQPTGFDAALAAGGVFAWHVDDRQPDQTDEKHYKVALMQADGRQDLEHRQNRGDAGDPYPGSSLNTALTPTSTPSTRSYAGTDSGVGIVRISNAGPEMTATVFVGGTD